MVYGSVEYLNEKKQQNWHRAFPGLFAGLVYLQFWSPAAEKGGRWRRLTLGATTWTKPNCQNHVVVKFFHPRGFDSWRGLLLLASTTWELSGEPRGAMMQIAIVQLLLLLIIIGLPASRHRCSKLLGASTTCGKSTHPDASHFCSSSNSKSNKRDADLFCIAIERITYYF